MTEHEHQMVRTLCARIVDEKKSAVLLELMVELEALLEKVTNHRARLSEVESEDKAN